MSKKNKRHKSGQHMELLKSSRQTVAAAWLFMILAILPLYMEDKLNRIGDAKYSLFFNVSAIFFIISMILCISTVARSIIREQAIWQKGNLLSPTDKFLLAFCAASLLSCLASPYPITALWGYPDWHMCLLVQLLMAAGYFFISRWYAKEHLIESSILLSSTLVSLLGILNRYEMDPLKVYSQMDRFEWNRLNLLSTIGNINWYCGYLSVVVPILAAAYWCNQKRHWVTRLALGFGAFSGFTALLIQSSESGYVTLAVLLAVLLVGSLGNRELELRFLKLAMMIPASCVIMIFLARILGIGMLLPYGSTVSTVVYHPVWVLVLLALLCFYCFLRWRRKKMPQADYDGKTIKRIFLVLLFLFLCAGVAVFTLCQVSIEFWQRLGEISWLRYNDEWGSGRGFLWNVTWRSFWESGILQKLFGAGPDCYAEYMYSHTAMDLQVSGQFAGAIFANAHNEWLTMLLNEGIVGTVAYIGFFMSALTRFYTNRKKNPELMAGVLAIASYCTNSIFSFQQVVSTPLIFLVIGVCEARCRILGRDAEDNSGAPVYPTKTN